MPRKKASIDPNQVEQLATIFCTLDEIAAVLGCSKRTLQRRFVTIIERGRAKGRMSLKRTQFHVANKKENPQMLIWLGKQHLGQADKISTAHTDASDLTRPHPEMGDDELYERIGRSKLDE